MLTYVHTCIHTYIHAYILDCWLEIKYKLACIGFYLQDFKEIGDELKRQIQHSKKSERTPVKKVLIHSYTSYTHTLIHSYTHTLIHSYTHTLIHSHTHTLIHSYTHTLIHSHTHTLYTHTLLHHYFMHSHASFIHSCTFHYFTHLNIHVLHCTHRIVSMSSGASIKSSGCAFVFFIISEYSNNTPRNWECINHNE